MSPQPLPGVFWSSAEHPEGQLIDLTCFIRTFDFNLWTSCKRRKYISKIICNPTPSLWTNPCCGSSSLSGGHFQPILLHPPSLLQSSGSPAQSPEPLSVSEQCQPRRFPRGGVSFWRTARLITGFGFGSVSCFSSESGLETPQPAAAAVLPQLSLWLERIELWTRLSCSRATRTEAVQVLTDPQD